MRRFGLLCALLIGGCMSGTYGVRDWAPQNGETPEDGGGTPKPDAAAIDTNFAGFNFGVAFTGTFDTGNRDRVKKAEVVNGIVRVSEEDNVQGRIMLEVHYFFPPKNRFLGIDNTNWGWGPFIALLPGSDNVIDAMGAGLMIGWKFVGDDDQSNASFNFGVGAVVDFDVEVLGDGVANGQPLPAGETSVRTVTTDQTGILAIVSFTWNF